MPRLQADTRRQTTLTEADRQQMYALYADYYAGTHEALFKEDLRNKDYVVLLRDEQTVLRGFSTLAMMDFHWQGHAARALFSGDTVIDHRFWGEQALPLAWCALAGNIKARAPNVPLYWFLIVKGHRTYRYLNVFAKRFYPTWRYPTPAMTQRLMNYLANSRFGKAFDPLSGLIRYPESRGHLKHEWNELSRARAIKPDVRFFLQRNPNYHNGDELVCLTCLETDNLRRHARQAFLQGMKACQAG